MTCEILTLAELVGAADLALFVRNKLTNPGSEFQTRLTNLLFSEGVAEGHISLVLDQSEVVGWARTDRWTTYDTLEAFVAPDYRGRGIASFAAAGLRSSVMHSGSIAVAVFHPHMALVAQRVGLLPVLFEGGNGRWTPA